jgi:glutaredoxin
MKDVVVFVTAWCPYCKRALSLIDKVRSEDDRYRDIEITVIDEEKEKQYADQFDYYQVPTFYVGGQKVHEGAADLESIRNVFQKAAQ